ncbi:MAG: hypothetical protein ACREL5_06205 [Gemmatimonadales bacterium]
MTSPYTRADQQALGELERAVGHLVDELATWRRRCQKAEAELQALKSEGGMVPGDAALRARGRALELEAENLDLRARVERARDMVLDLQRRLIFVDEAGSPEPAS